MSFEFTDDQLRRVHEVVESRAGEDIRLSKMTSVEIARIIVDDIWDEEVEMNSPFGMFLGEVIERLLIQGNYVRGQHTAPIPEEWN